MGYLFQHHYQQHNILGFMEDRLLGILHSMPGYLLTTFYLCEIGLVFCAVVVKPSIVVKLKRVMQAGSKVNRCMPKCLRYSTCHCSRLSHVFKWYFFIVVNKYKHVALRFSAMDASIDLSGCVAYITALRSKFADKCFTMLSSKPLHSVIHFSRLLRAQNTTRALASSYGVGVVFCHLGHRTCTRQISVVGP